MSGGLVLIAAVTAVLAGLAARSQPRRQPVRITSRQRANRER
jgi:hypothetical protein